MSERRSDRRVPVNIDARFFRKDMFYSGTILNLSENGMLIKTSIEVPCGESFILMIPEKKGLPKLVARVKRISGSISHGMGVRLIAPPQQYTDFVEDLSYYLYV